MFVDKPPRDHALHRPWSWHQMLAAALVLYVVGIFLLLALPVLLASGALGSESLLAVLVCGCGPLFIFFVAAYVRVSLEDPQGFQHPKESPLPSCAYCRGQMPLTASEVGEQHFSCHICGFTKVSSNSAEPGIAGLWLYGRGHSFSVLPQIGGTLQFVEGKDKGKLQRCSGLDKQQYAVDASGVSLTLGFQSMHTLRMLCNDDPPIAAHRALGSIVLGCWTYPFWSACLEEKQFPEGWDTFSIMEGCGSDLVMHFHTGGLEESGFLYDGPLQQVLSDPECFIAQLTNRTPPLSHTSNMSVRIRVGVDHLILQRGLHGVVGVQVVPEEWDGGVVAVREGVACCKQCGVACQAPSDVGPHGTAHCGHCRKCVPSFDHHCMYLNQCIGGENYTAWLLLVLSLFCLVASMTIVSAWILIQRVVGSNRFNDAVGKHTSPITLAFFIFPSVIVGMVIAAFLLALLFLHAMLFVEGKTTMEHVLGISAQDRFQRRYAKHRWRSFKAASRRIGRNPWPVVSTAEQPYISQIDSGSDLHCIESTTPSSKMEASGDSSSSEGEGAGERMDEEEQGELEDEGWNPSQGSSSKWAKVQGKTESPVQRALSKAKVRASFLGTAMGRDDIRSVREESTLRHRAALERSATTGCLERSATTGTIGHIIGHRQRPENTLRQAANGAGGKGPTFERSSSL